MSELLTILRDKSDVRDGKIADGLCHELYGIEISGYISYEEYRIVRTYIVSNMPKKTIELRGREYKSLYGWIEKEWQPRLEWLNKHIELNK